jgi:hypothetical protein
MANAKASLAFWSTATNVPAATTRATPVASSAVQTDGNGGELVFRIINSGALNAPCTIEFQESIDGTNWFTYYSVYSADLLSGTKNEGPSITAPRGAKFQRAIAYGNTNSACTVESYFFQLTVS